MDKFKNFLSQAREKLAPVLEGAGKVFSVIGKIFYNIGRFIFLIRKILLAVPVVLGALYIADYVRDRLPEQVGLLIQESGAYTYVIAQETAINGCLLITAGCLVLMFISRRTVYPWLISIFSLILPVILLLTNIFPA